MADWFGNIELEGLKVELIPLVHSHKDGLLKAASDGKLWELWFASVPSNKNIDEYINKALKEKKEGKGFPLSIVIRKTDKIIGSTRYCNATPEHRRLEIGYTWYSKRYQRAGFNRECKYLLLRHAFEVLNCIAVEFRTNWFNRPSKIAIGKLGAKQDGILRNHKVNPDGSTRDTVVFSITHQEWSGVKKSLEYEMNKYK